MLLLRANTLALGHSGCRPLLVDRLLDVPRRSASTRSCPSRAASARPATSRRSPTSRCRSSAAGSVEFGGSVVPALVALREAGLEPLDARGQGRPRAPQRDADDERDRGAAARRRGPARADGQRRRGDERRGAARDGRRVRRGLPAGPAASRARSRSPPSCATCCATAGSSAATTATPTRSRTRTRCAACRRSTARSATRSTTSAGSSTSSSTRATDNPLVFPGGGVADVDTIATGGGRVISGGNFHGEPIALALDFAKLALAELGSISERRTALLVDARLNGGLPPFLARVVGHRLRDDDLPVHGRGPRLREQGARPSGVGRLDPDQRQPGGPRLDGLDRRPARPDGPRARRADPRDRGSWSRRRRSTSGWRPDGDARAREQGVARGAGARPGASSRISTATASRGRTWRPRPRSSTTARSPTSPAEVAPRSGAPRSARGRSAPPRRRDVVLAVPDAPQRRVDLVEEGPALAPLLEPHQVARVDARDLADRPADVAPERQHAP